MYFNVKAAIFIVYLDNATKVTGVKLEQTLDS